jgi:putative acetyltransferase
MSEIKIRKANAADLDELRFLFRDTIKTVNAKDYSPEQINFWADGFKHINAWTKKINTQQFFAAYNEREIVGFASLTKDGLLDFMYVHHNYQGIGIGKSLVEKIVETARGFKLERIVSDVSITAKPFFEKCGFVKTGDNLKDYGTVSFANSIMEKTFR